MKLEYNILWLDDNIDEFEDDGFFDQINSYLADNGFDLNIDPVTKYSDFTKFIDAKKESYDLILTDYNLNNEEQGDMAVLYTRDPALKYNTEILFYTAKTIEPTFDHINRIDRISYLETDKHKHLGSHQEVVTNKVLELISYSIKKYQDIVPMRGLIVNETSLLDEQVDNIIQRYLQCKQPCKDCKLVEKCDPISSYIIEKLDTCVHSKLKVIDKKNFRNIQKDTVLFSASYKQDALAKILEVNKLDDFTKDYKSKIINVRNKFAHAVLKEDPNTHKKYFQSVGNGKDILIFDEELCKKIRNDIKQFKDKLDEVEKKLFGE